jgi:protein-L-isoaspartate(D-aspartate) O-methyltransferase
VLRAFAEVPREYFHYLHDSRRSTAGDAYEAEAKPWGLGYGSALSDYLGQAYMTQVCAPKPDHVVLEIGTGSGFQAALLSRIVAKQYSVETRVGDGFFGWPEVTGGFDTIIVTCAAQWVPPALLEQLKPGGRLVIPIGQPFRRGQFLYIYTKDADGRVRSRKDVGVYFIPMTGAMMNRPELRQAPPS